jgi:EpsI family protein
MRNQRPTNPFNLLKTTPLVVLTLALIAQAVALRAVSRPESVIPPPALNSFPVQIGGWKLAQEGYVDQETRDLLQADDLLSRTYVRSGDPLPVNLFIASFLSQRNGKTPHSPKNCLPGAGWVQQTNEILPVDIPGFGRIEVQHYLVANRDARSDVMYWYQSRNRVVASEYRAKFFSVADAIRYNRTDTALVKFTTPVAEGHADQARNDNIEFIRAVFPLLGGYLPK